MLLVSLFTMSIRLKEEAMLHPGTDVQTHAYVLEGMFRVPSGGGGWVEEDLNLRPHA